jgi:hypothetical protein
MHYTTIEQSKKLMELGLSPDTADMYWAIDANIVITEPYITKTEHEILIPAYKGAIPCWSIGALLELLKNYTDCNKLDIFSNRASKWSVTISYYDQVWKEHEEIDLNLMNAMVNTTLFLLENGYIKKGK